MPISLPVLDDRNYEQILDEALRRIPVYNPEWTNTGIESDPGVTIVQLFAFLTESLLYRANRVPELNRLKFLQLLNVPLLPAAAADGLIAIANERGPVAPLLLEQGVVAAAGNVKFITRDPLNVLPIQVQCYYKRQIPTDDPSYALYREQYEAVVAAALAAQADAEGLPFPGSEDFEDLGITPQFYEPVRLEDPKRGEPLPAFEIETTLDRSLYLALLAPQPELVPAVRRAIANQVLSLGLAPATAGIVPALKPQQTGSSQVQSSGLVFEVADTSASTTQPVARYARLKVIQQMDIFKAPGIVMVELPAADRLTTWSFSEPLDEGTSAFPPRLEDDKVSARLVTWLRIRLPDVQDLQATEQTDRRLAWVGVNATRVAQAVPIFNEFLGLGNGEPDQTLFLANVPVLPTTLLLAVEETTVQPPAWIVWRLVDDLLAFGPDDRVYALDAESGAVHFGDGLRGQRPRGRILATYEYGGGPQGNAGIGAITASPDACLQGGFTISNPIPTSGGAFGETPADGERRIAKVVRHRDRLVTAQDFRDVTRRAPGVNIGRVEVLSLFHPEQPALRAPGLVTVLVIPQFDPLDPLWPVPDRLFLQRVCDHLDSRRLITTEVYVRGPVYVPVYISVGLQVRAGFFVDQVEQDVENALRFYLSSLPPGGVDGLGWALQKRLVRNDLAAVATRVLGVEYLVDIQMGVETLENTAEYTGFTGLRMPRVAGVSVRQGAVEPLDTVFAPTGTAPAPTQLAPIPVTKIKC